MTEQSNNAYKSHAVELVVGRLDTSYEQARTQELLEDAYARIRQRAQEHDMVILSSIQTCEHLTSWTVCYTIVVNWIKRAEWEALQRRSLLAQAAGMPPKGVA